MIGNAAGITKNGPIGAGFHGYSVAGEAADWGAHVLRFVNLLSTSPAPGTSQAHCFCPTAVRRNYDVIKERTGAGTLPDGRNQDADRNVAWRHNDYANIVFFDGHAESRHKDDIRQNAKLWIVTR